MTLWTRQSARGRRSRAEIPTAWVPVVDAAPASGAAEPAPDVAHAVRVYTTTDVVVGTIVGAGRLSDILNLRTQVRVEHASIRDLGAPATHGRVETEILLDPFEIDIAMGSHLPDAPWTRARRIHKVSYPVRIEAGPYAIAGTIHVFPGADPASIASTSAALFVPVTGASVRRDGRVVSDPTLEVVLVNRHLVRRIVQADLADAVDAGGLLVARRAPVA